MTERSPIVVMPNLGVRVQVTLQDGDTLFARRGIKPDAIFRRGSIEWLNDDDKFIEIPGNPVVSWSLESTPRTNIEEAQRQTIDLIEREKAEAVQFILSKMTREDWHLLCDIDPNLTEFITKVLSEKEKCDTHQDN